MTKIEYLQRLNAELSKNKIPDAEDIIGEYEQHFAFKLADGFSEEEIAAKWGTPEVIAAQFALEMSQANTARGGKTFIIIGLWFAAIIEAMIYVLFFAWGVVLFAASLASAATGAALIGRFNIAGLIPYMPYVSALIFGICFLSFAVFLAAGAYYYLANIKQMIKVTIRWHKNMISGNMLPSLPVNPQFSAKTKRKLRTVLSWSVAVFGATFVLGIVVAQIHSGALEFWHAWSWFL